jgi:signal transduction histidine kinase
MVLLREFIVLSVGDLMKRPVGIRTALLVTVSSLTLIPLLTAMMVSMVMFHLNISGRIHQDNQRVAHTVSSAVEQFLVRPVVTLKHIRGDLENGDLLPADMRDHVDKELDEDPLFESVLLVNAAGRLLLMAGPEALKILPTTLHRDFSGSDLFKQVKKTGKIVWSEPFVSLRTGESVISVALPWNGGMITGTLNLSYLCKLVEPTRTASNAYAFIVSPSGRLIAHPDRALLGEKENFVSLPQIMAGFQGTSGTYSFKIGERSVIGTVLPFGQNDWVVVSVQDKAESFAPVYKLEALLGLWVLLVLAAVLFMAFRKIGSITTPLQLLTDSSRQLAEGKLLNETHQLEAYREIHDLYDNFQLMATAVQQREIDLQKKNEELAIIEKELRDQVLEYHRTHEALLTEKNKLESILSCMGEGLSIQNLDLKVQLQNSAHVAMVGKADNKFCYQLYDNQDAPCKNCPVLASIEDGEVHVTLRELKRDNEPCYLEITASPLRNAAGEIVGGIEIVRDVTGRIKDENEIRHLNQVLENRVSERTAELEIANKELESFSYSVSHDLRSPLRHISSFSTILLDEYAAQLDEDGKVYLSRIIAGCEKMGLLIDDLLQLSYISSRELHGLRINLSTIARRIASELGERSPDRIVRFEIAEGLVAFGDERLLEVMLRNLLENAWKYTSRKDDALVEFGCQVSSGRPVYYVRDNGSGFDKNYSDKLFTPFHRLHGAEFEGTGIGLAIVQRIVHRHGGEIWADAVEGEGATFFFTLRSE